MFLKNFEKGWPLANYLSSLAWTHNSPARYGALTTARKALSHGSEREIPDRSAPAASNPLPSPPPSTLPISPISHFPPPPPISRSHSSPLFLSSLVSLSPLHSLFFPPGARSLSSLSDFLLSHASSQCSLPSSFGVSMSLTFVTALVAPSALPAFFARCSRVALAE
jgi:hypothetical protein